MAERSGQSQIFEVHGRGRAGAESKPSGGPRQENRESRGIDRGRYGQGDARAGDRLLHVPKSGKPWTAENLVLHRTGTPAQHAGWSGWTAWPPARCASSPLARSRGRRSARATMAIASAKRAWCGSERSGGRGALKAGRPFATGTPVDSDDEAEDDDPADDEDDMARLLERAEAGDASAMMSIARRYRDGDGVPHDHVQTFYWFRRVADLGNAAAMFLVGSATATACAFHKTTPRRRTGTVAPPT